MNARTSFLSFSGVISAMASTYYFICRIPVLVTQKPRYSILVCLKDDFLILHWSPLSLRFFSISYNFSKRLYQSPLVIINRSLMYAQIHSNPRNILFMFSWKMSGELLTPIGRRLYRYFPHGRMIVNMLLACLLRRAWTYCMSPCKNFLQNTIPVCRLVLPMGWGWREGESCSVLQGPFSWKILIQGKAEVSYSVPLFVQKIYLIGDLKVLSLRVSLRVSACWLRCGGGGINRVNSPWLIWYSHWLYSQLDLLRHRIILEPPCIT